MERTMVPTGMLTILGGVIAVLGLFGGGIAWTALGLAAIALAGVIALLSNRMPRT